MTILIFFCIFPLNYIKHTPYMEPVDIPYYF